MTINSHNLSDADMYDSVADPRSGAFLTPGSRIRNRFFSGSRIPDPKPIFLELSDKFLGKTENWPKFFSSAFKK